MSNDCTLMIHVYLRLKRENDGCMYSCYRIFYGRKLLELYVLKKFGYELISIDINAIAEFHIS